MKICTVNAENIALFEPYIPKSFLPARETRSDHVIFGMYDEGRALGAAELYVYDGTVEIESLVYNDDIEPGICEEALTDLILEQNWPMYRILYVADESSDYLERYDYTMLSLGYAPAPGEVTRYVSDLSTIKNLQEKLLKRFSKLAGSNRFLTGDKLSQKQINAYNMMYPLTKYVRREENEQLSCFMIKDDLPIGGVLARETEDGSLEFSWMNAKGSKPAVIMEMVFYVIMNAMKLYDLDTKVILCPFSLEVSQLIEKFGFSKDPNGHETRIYTYYTD